MAKEGTRGAVVEVLREGQAYLVELFDGWVKSDAQGNVMPADPADPEAFLDTLGVEAVAPHQLRLVTPASETVGARVQLLTVMERLPEDLLEEVVDFAEFLRQRQQQRRVAEP